MLRSLKDLERNTVTATDGDLSLVANFLLDDKRWIVHILAWRQAFMVPIRLAFVFAVLGVLTAACNSERDQECDHLLGAIQPIQEGTPSADAVDHVNKDVGALTLQDQPLHIYAENYQHTLTVLTNTLRLEATPDAPGGTDDVVKHNLQEARTDRDDIARYCAN